MGSKIKDKIITLRLEGRSYNEIVEMLKISKGVVSYHCKNNSLNTPINGVCIIDDNMINEINEYYLSHTVEETANRFKLGKSTIIKYTQNKRKVLSDDERKERNYLKVKKRRQRLKEMSVEYLGGKCMKCGYKKCIAALDFHHRNPNVKEFQISKYLNLKWENIKVELDKCDLLCANCHREIHYL